MILSFRLQRHRNVKIQAFLN